MAVKPLGIGENMPRPDTIARHQALRIPEVFCKVQKQKKYWKKVWAKMEKTRYHNNIDALNRWVKGALRDQINFKMAHFSVEDTLKIYRIVEKFERKSH